MLSLSTDIFGLLNLWTGIRLQDYLHFQCCNRKLYMSKNVRFTKSTMSKFKEIF